MFLITYLGLDQHDHKVSAAITLHDNYFCNII